jgi:hypothetical protein
MQALLARPIPVGDGASSAVYGGGRVWVANRSETSLTRIDARAPAGSSA